MVTKTKKSPERIQKPIAWALFSIGIACIAGLLIWLGSSTIHRVIEQHRLSSNGVQTTAIVTDHYSRYMTYGKSGGRTYYYIDYAFTYQDSTGSHAQTHSKDEVHFDTWQAYTKGSRISVTYEPGKPSNSQPTADIQHFAASDSLMIFLVVSVALTFLLLRKNSLLGKRYRSLWNSARLPVRFLLVAGILLTFAIVSRILIALAEHTLF